MKNFRLLGFLLLLFFIQFSCSSTDHSESNKFTFDDFPEKKQLTGKKYVFPEVLVPSRILYKNGKLIVSDRSGLAILHRISAETMSYEQEMGQIGWGPGELPGVWSIDPGVNEDTFWAYSGTGKLFAEYHLFDSDKLYKKSIKQAENWYLATQLRIVDDNSFLGSMINGEDQFVVFDSIGNAKIRLGNWGELMPELSYNPYLIADLHQGDLIGNAKNRMFVLPSLNVDRVEIINLKKNTSKAISGPINHFPKYTISNSSGYDVILLDNSTKITTYNTGFVGQNQIFLAYIGLNLRLSNKGEYVKDILVLDFDGKPVVHYMLDQSVLNITVDEGNRKIYGTTTDEEPGILVFDY
ncbi:BF3164 family lipoprotein [Belliella pelovolcani]|uniref:BF3164 family lipoprotein n=1 Tax=Belliella pelovolcani TaxID=529505 RepID=UPI00391C98FA